tara:strand:+ start:72 stop:173 length:102 start_codon:yes stop_codon:yes gene_type:complete
LLVEVVAVDLLVVEEAVLVVIENQVEPLLDVIQ